MIFIATIISLTISFLSVMVIFLPIAYPLSLLLRIEDIPALWITTVVIILAWFLVSFEIYWRISAFLTSGIIKYFSFKNILTAYKTYAFLCRDYLKNKTSWEIISRNTSYDFMPLGNDVYEKNVKKSIILPSGKTVTVKMRITRTEPNHAPGNWKYSLSEIKM